MTVQSPFPLVDQAGLAALIFKNKSESVASIRMGKIKCGIVGLGRIGFGFDNDPLRPKPASHVGAITQNQDCTLVAGIDSDIKRREQFSARWDARTFLSLKEALTQTSIDILHIATPPETHFSVLKECIRAKIGLVICEKPIVAHATEAQEMKQLLESSVTKIIVNYPRRYSKRYDYVSALIGSGKFGKLLSLRGEINYGVRREVSEMLRNDASHLINMLQFFTNIDSPIILSSVRVPTAKGYALLSILDFAGVPVSLQAAPGSDYLLFEITANFEYGRVVINNETINEFSSTPGKAFRKYRVLTPRPVSMLEEKSAMAAMMEDAVQTFRNQTEPISDWASAIATVYLIEEILALSPDTQYTI